jgi:hypothetical protein
VAVLRAAVIFSNLSLARIIIAIAILLFAAVILPSKSETEASILFTGSALMDMDRMCDRVRQLYLALRIIVN